MLQDPAVAKKAQLREAIISACNSGWDGTTFSDTTKLSTLKSKFQDEVSFLYRLKDDTTDDGGVTFIKEKAYLKSEKSFKEQLEGAQTVISLVVADEQEASQDSSNPRYNFVNKCVDCGKVIRPSMDAVLDWKKDQHRTVYGLLRKQVPTLIKQAAMETFGLNTPDYQQAVSVGVSALSTDRPGHALSVFYAFDDRELTVLRVMGALRMGQCGGCACLKAKVKEWGLKWDARKE
uniref:Uncharacterized protein n=1 Tax=Chromera velia CCMP2878 TaxID=1169474 RepID=A0A0G4GZK8_9ALVE|eukprot:Cvel_23998.t1-p1 / transcript=Cvel_23998.t1 / gene=Cvel_23998 / organism=Chromera_velia_CCMP2878 / gene_product=hypothetical protein / transcript_product=hypothetical protein / location=Cvel_scaffold2543:20165-21831(+) / protein_length=233 / sequence_SO=supercontig / SO=protein_coding / is_pseudo=false